MVDKTGTFIIHPTSEGTSVAQEDFFKEIVAKGEGKTKYMWQGKSKYQHFRYYPKSEVYVSTTIYESDLLEVLNKSRNAIIIVVIIGIMIAVFVGIIMGKSIQKTISSINVQFKDLVDAITFGRLNKRADVMKTNLEFRGITKGLNNVVDSLVGFIDGMPTPAMVIDTEFNIQYMNGIGAKLGNRNPKELEGTKCYDHFKTSHCKTSKCACAQTMNTGVGTNEETDAHPGNLNLDIQYIATPIKDLSGRMIGASEWIVDQTDIKTAGRLARKIATYQEEETKKVTDNLVKLAKGETNIIAISADGDKDITESKVKFDTINNALNQCVDAINLLAADAGNLVKAGIGGNLSTRADITKHMGEYRKIIEGVNDTLDAVVGPLNVAADYVSRISIGDMPPVITEKYNGDFNVIINNLNTMITALNEVTAKAKLVANGDLTVDLKKRSEKDELMQSLTEMVKSTANIISEFQSASNNISASSQQMSSTSQQMSQGASEQASSAEEVSSSMEQMTANIQQNTENAQQTEKIALNASDGINRVNDASDQTLKYMQEIADKVSIIGEIARQTNILALNAAVEAARAGEHGKGFAVVAAEVRKLAERSQVSAVEIDTLTRTASGQQKSRASSCSHCARNRQDSETSAGDSCSKYRAEFRSRPGEQCHTATEPGYTAECCSL